MIKWEYLSQSINMYGMYWGKSTSGEDIVTPISFLGLQGWELVSVVTDKKTHQDENCVAFFKRRLE